MQNKGFVKVLAVLLTLICLFYLSFSFVTNKYVSKAEQLTAQGKDGAAYLDSMRNEKVYLNWKTLKECEELQIGLGLDLKGGMNVVLEVSVPDVVKNLAGESANDPKFKKAYDTARKEAKEGNVDFVEAFVNAYSAQNGKNKMGGIFASKLKEMNITYSSTDADVKKVLDEEVKAAVQNSEKVVRSRIDRFGVAQRARLWAKGENPPHILVMTATPIPRTLAMTIYGDLDVSIIDELPPGRKPVQTIHKYDSQMTSLYAGIRQQIRLGRQVYIVYPLITESEKSDLKNLEEGYAALCDIFPEFKISKVHGKMKSKEKDAEMQKFVSGETQILVATTVIEVGVNVPNASVMVILDSQRFGLSQLHQLRGRVGRGADQSYCILVTTYKLSAETSKRIDIMCETNDGFRIAEADLKLRGPGDLEGTQQSGIAFDLKIADIARDGQIMAIAREEAQKIIDADPTCTSSEYAMLWRRLRELRDTNVNWAAIS